MKTFKDLEAWQMPPRIPLFVVGFLISVFQKETLFLEGSSWEWVGMEKGEQVFSWVWALGSQLGPLTSHSFTPASQHRGQNLFFSEMMDGDAKNL